jgi:hypothetical protein
MLRLARARHTAETTQRPELQRNSCGNWATRCATLDSAAVAARAMRCGWEKGRTPGRLVQNLSFVRERAARGRRRTCFLSFDGTRTCGRSAGVEQRSLRTRDATIRSPLWRPNGTAQCPHGTHRCRQPSPFFRSPGVYACGCERDNPPFFFSAPSGAASGRAPEGALKDKEERTIVTCAWIVAFRSAKVAGIDATFAERKATEGFPQHKRVIQQKRISR